jgi:peroxiredoxin
MEILTVGKTVPDSFSDAQILNENGEKIKMGIFWQSHPVLFVFIRHFGCFGCATQMEAIFPRLNEISKLGIRIVVIGNGEVRYIEGFKDRFQLYNMPVEINTDPTLNVYKHAGLTRSFLIAFGPTTWYERTIAFSKGFSNKNQGDHAQMGGTMLIDEAGRLEFYYQNKTVANHSDPTEIIDTIYKFIGKRNKDRI